jgi:asparaginyl-tRNA synthetase
VATTWRSSPSACCRDAITRLENFIAKPFERIDYTDAIEILKKSNQKFEFPVAWGIDLQTEHERYLAEKHVGRPVVVMNYPEQIKAFYMRLNDDEKPSPRWTYSRPASAKSSAAASARNAWTTWTAAWPSSVSIPPHTVGTVICAATARCPTQALALGFERLLVYVCGLQNIRDAIPYPRAAGSAEF